MTDPNEAFRYFWLFFRLDAFVTREVERDGQTRESSFLDMVLDESESYAKGLGERLKERVFEQVFPHFAAGFIEHLKGQVGLAGPHQTSLLPVSEAAFPEARAGRRVPPPSLQRNFDSLVTRAFRVGSAAWGRLGEGFGLFRSGVVLCR